MDSGCSGLFGRGDRGVLQVVVADHIDARAAEFLAQGDDPLLDRPM
jgi:hypothetical protein